MKNKKTIISWLIVISICSIAIGFSSFEVIASQPAYSINDCLAMVEEAKFDANETIKYTDSIITKNDEIYSFDSDIASYKVVQSTGEISCIYRKDILDCDNLSITLDEAMQKARDVVKQYRNDFDLNEMTLTISKPQKSKSLSRYMFEWRLLKEGVDIGHTIYVEISGKGDFMCYMCNNNYDYEPDLNQVKINETDAKSLASGYLKDGLDNDKASNLVIESSQLKLYDNKLVWAVKLYTTIPMQGDENKTNTYYYLLIIDAESGNIIAQMAG